MAKRKASEILANCEPATKRLRPPVVDRLSKLSDELILRVLSFLPESQLVVCHRLSHKYQALAEDGQLWKQHYYNRFVRPRASRLPGLKDRTNGGECPSFPSKAPRWLEDEHLVGRGTKTNWKKQYKLRHNWRRGSAAVNEIELSDQLAVPPILVQMSEGVIYMVDKADGLRAWTAKAERKMVAQIHFDSANLSPPTSLAVDSEVNDKFSRVVVGFEDGAFGVYSLSPGETRFGKLFSHPPSSNGLISAVSVAWPYVLTMTATQRLSLYAFEDKIKGHLTERLDHPLLLHSLKSHTVWPPLSTALHPSPANITISVAYALPTYLSGWTVGIQEVRLTPAGNLIESRLASAIDHHYRPLNFAAPPMMRHLTPPTIGLLATSNAMELRHIHAKPNSLSYTHPYLLVSHPDNTLTLYLVTSTNNTLSISAGSRLWGHTSSVSGAHVGGKGKAVSVSNRGDELRVWELEGGFASSAARRRLALNDLSVRIRPGTPDTVTQPGLGLVNQAISSRSGNPCAPDSGQSELTLTRGWIGFDEENVVVLKEQSLGRQALVVYDFT